MSLLEPLIKQLLVDGFTSQRRQQGKSLGAGILLGVVAAFFAFAGVVFVLYAVYGKMLMIYNNVPEAALATALITFGLSILTAALGWLVATTRRSRHEPAPAPSAEMTEAIQKALVTVTGQVEEIVGDNPGTALLLAGLAGYMASCRLR